MASQKRSAVLQKRSAVLPKAQRGFGSKKFPKAQFLKEMLSVFLLTGKQELEDLDSTVLRIARFHRVPHSLSSVNPQAVGIPVQPPSLHVIQERETTRVDLDLRLSNRLDPLTGRLNLSTVDSGFRC